MVEVCMQVVATHHIAVRTPQFEVMERFYTQTLGFAVTKRWDDVTIIFIDVGSTTIELIGRTPSDPAAKPLSLDEGVGFNHLALEVADVDQAYRELVEAGVSILREPRNFKDVRIAFFADPDGNVLELVGPPST
jgi:catechol 2,3-dioxygenase-like lactoylglutathione lyase family enzyme